MILIHHKVSTDIISGYLVTCIIILACISLSAILDKSDLTPVLRDTLRHPDGMGQCFEKVIKIVTDSFSVDHMKGIKRRMTSF